MLAEIATHFADRTRDSRLEWLGSTDVAERSAAHLMQAVVNLALRR